MIDIKKIRADAERANQKWFGQILATATGIQGTGPNYSEERFWPKAKADATHIANCDPETILAMVAVVEAAIIYERITSQSNLMCLVQALKPFRAQSAQDEERWG